MNLSGLVLQQDKAAANKAHIVQEYFRRHGWIVLEWPPYSPDLNIIENMWSVNNTFGKQTMNCENLEEKVHEFWNSIDKERVENFYNSFPKRLRDDDVFSWRSLNKKSPTLAVSSVVHFLPIYISAITLNCSL